MIIAIIILGILLVISILFNLASFRTLFAVMRDIRDLENLREEYDFINGDVEIDENRIANKFPNTILLCHVEKNHDPKDTSTTKVVDISSYPKNHVIGITYFVQHQFFSDLKDSVKMDELRNHLRAEFIEDHPEEDDLEFIDKMIDEAIHETLGGEYNIDEAGGAMTRPLIPNCTVYQLKDGRWLWRQESF